MAVERENAEPAEPDETSRKSYTVIVATGLTVIWAIVAGLIFSSAAMCVSPGTGNFIADRFFCLPANAIGDMLAGAFAPLAFLWLTAAVILQRNELAAQRQELRESREVARQQVQEARNNVLLIQTQTKMLEDDRRRREQRECDEDIEEMVEILSQMLPHLDGFAIGDHASEDATHFSADAEVIVVEAPREFLDPFSKLRHYAEELRSMRRKLFVWQRQGIAPFYSYVSQLQGTVETLESLQKLQAGASGPMLAKLQLFTLVDLHAEVVRLVSVLTDQGKELSIPF